MFASREHLRDEVLLAWTLTASEYILHSINITGFHIIKGPHWDWSSRETVYLRKCSKPTSCNAWLPFQGQGFCCSSLILSPLSSSTSEKKLQIKKYKSINLSCFCPMPCPNLARFLFLCFNVDTKTWHLWKLLILKISVFRCL